MDKTLFPGFEARFVETEVGPFFAEIGGDGPPIVLLHGFPETHACWHLVAPALAERFRVVAMDMRGYGASAAPRGDGRDTYSKRTMAKDVIDVMERLGHRRFALVGHDRGARVGYRLALDHPGRLTALVLLDIVPTMIVWEQIQAGLFEAPHWNSLARPYPTPEAEIEKDPVGYFEGWLMKWSESGSLSSFDPRALESYRESYRDPARVHAFCEDYRAGATSDVEADQADLRQGHMIDCPMLVIWSDYLLRGGGGDKETPLEIWQRTFAPNAEEERVQAGHFIAEEASETTITALRRFLAAHAMKDSPISHSAS